MTNYNAFASYYDAVVGNRPEDIQQIVDALTTISPKASSVLELACGTGTVLRAFPARFSKVGLDFSQSMLRLAKKKLPNVKFIHADMSNFNIKQKFDIVLCVFDSVNHLRTWKQWQNTFLCSKAHLNQHGVFLFDIHTDFGLKKASDRTPWLKTIDNKTHAIVDVTYLRKGFSSWSVKIFTRTKKDLYRLYEENIIETAFPIEKVLSFLSSHFRHVSVKEKLEGKDFERLEKVTIICKSPKSA